ncbi:MAG: trehalose-phosphatase, partial [Spirochaetota bacterium]
KGKKIIEVRPDIDWHKGKAIRWIMHELHADASGTVPVYIGDDITDEDGFRAVNDSGGISILVGFHGSSSTASYSLKNVYQVELFLNELAKLYHE